MMNTSPAENEKKVSEFLTMIESRESTSDPESFYHPDVQQVEYPNAVVKNTTVRALADLKEGSEKALKIMAKEVYEIKNLYSSDDTVILEAIWR